MGTLNALRMLKEAFMKMPLPGGLREEKGGTLCG